MLKVCDFASQVIDRVVVDQYTMRFQEAIQLVTGTKTKQLLQLVLRQVAALVFLKREQFERWREGSSPATVNRAAKSSGISTVRYMERVGNISEERETAAEGVSSVDDLPSIPAAH